MEIEYKGEYVRGMCNLDTTDMVCVPSKPQYGDVDLCLKSDNHTGMNVAFCTISTKSLPFKEKKKLGYEIERRWNELARLQQENEQLQLKNKELVEALKPFKEVGDCVDIDFDYVEIVVGNKYKNKCKDFADNFIKAKEAYDRSVKSE